MRDKKVLYIDAINRAQWLRSNVAAHRAQRWLSRLHPMDVLNVQYLARALVMSAARFPWWSQRQKTRQRSVSKRQAVASVEKVL